MLSTGSDPSASTAPLIVIRDTGLPPPKAELDPLLAVHAAAFPTDAEAQLVRRLFAGHDVLFSVAADRDDQLVGHVLVSAMTHEHGGSVRGLAALAPLAVHPDHQRRGVGTALAREAVRQAREHRLAALFVLGDPDFYRPLGFRPAADHGYTPPESVPPEHHHAFQVLPFPHRRPVPPGRVRFAGPFDDLDN
ncbi:MAG: N-acetyltransferase [Planctomycetota bacterium]